jgi:LacI family transcriptional regulator
MQGTVAGPGGDGITIADVAAQAGVSIRTVSRVINHSPKVNGETRERIEAAIAALGFRPSARARGLATGRSYLIGMVHNDRNALVLDSVQRGIVGEAARRGYELVVHPTPTQDDRSVEDVIDFARRSRVDGIVALPPVSGLTGLAKALSGVGVPAIALSSIRLDDFAAMLISDERSAAGEVARHFLDLGHRHIALVSGPATAHSAAERRAGFIAALAEAGHVLAGDIEGDYGFASGVAAARALLDLSPMPTAIFAANDVMAAGVLKEAAARAIAVPGQLSVVGFDGSLLAQMLTPALSTVHRPLGDMAAQATACLIDMIEGTATDTDLHVTLGLVPGESSGPAPH